MASKITADLSTIEKARDVLTAQKKTEGYLNDDLTSRLAEYNSMLGNAQDEKDVTWTQWAKDFTNARIEDLAAFESGTANQLTLGTSDEIEGASKGLENQMLGRNDLSLDDNVTDATIAAREREGELAENNPAMNVLGNMFGGLLQGTGAGKMMKKGLKHAAPWMQKSALVAHNAPLKRVGLQTILGGAEGATIAHNEQRDMLGGATEGAIGGAVGQATLGELAPWLYSGAKNVYRNGEWGVSPKNEEAMFRELYGRVSAVYGDKTDVEAVRRMQKEALRMGENATFTDLEEVLFKEGISLVQDARGVKNSSALIRQMRQIEKHGGDEYEKELLGVLHNPRTKVQVEADDLANRKEWSPKYEEALANSNVKVKPHKFLKAIRDDFYKSYAHLDEESPKAGEYGAKLRKFIVQRTNAKTKYPTLNADGTVKSGAVTNKNGDVVRAAITIEDVPQMTMDDVQDYRNVIDSLFNENLTVTAKTMDKGANNALAATRNTAAGVMEHDPKLSELNKKYQTAYGETSAYEMGTKVYDDAVNIKDVNHLAEIYGGEGTTEGKAFIEGTKAALEARLKNVPADEVADLFSEATNETAKMYALYGEDMTKAMYGSAAQSKAARENATLLLADAEKNVASHPSMVQQGLDYGLAGVGLLTDKASQAGGIGALRRSVGSQNKAGTEQKFLADILGYSGSKLNNALLDMENLAQSPQKLPSQVGGQVGVGYNTPAEARTEPKNPASLLE